MPRSTTVSRKSIVIFPNKGLPRRCAVSRCAVQRLARSAVKSPRMLSLTVLITTLNSIGEPPFRPSSEKPAHEPPAGLLCSAGTAIASSVWFGWVRLQALSLALFPVPGFDWKGGWRSRPPGILWVSIGMYSTLRRGKAGWRQALPYTCTATKTENKESTGVEPGPFWIRTPLLCRWQTAPRTDERTAGATHSDE
ncbi:hypothetical protein N7510_010660 [Penicillium lagena]|uniref:uncharacterized protein n=1 Tax=Penicillium lagena TaxID=94218 RepID=UPI0025401575|nr:uncharacterized protein N7510_010660 [Penicillium lagena]KAJ5601126.1 hypothetical protein N7510_010660 [Penicillium lagena]